MGTRKTSKIIVKCINDEYFLNLECCNCGDKIEYEGKADTIKDYEDVKDLVNEFMEDGMLCLDCVNGED